MFRRGTHYGFEFIWLWLIRLNFYPIFFSFIWSFAVTFCRYFLHVQIHNADCELQFTYVIRYGSEGMFPFITWSDDFIFFDHQLENRIQWHNYQHEIISSIIEVTSEAGYSVIGQPNYNNNKSINLACVKHSFSVSLKRIDKTFSSLWNFNFRFSFDLFWVIWFKIKAENCLEPFSFNSREEKHVERTFILKCLKKFSNQSCIVSSASHKHTHPVSHRQYTRQYQLYRSREQTEI